MAKRAIRWGIAGVGKISSDFAYALSITEGATLAAVGGRNEARSKSFADAVSRFDGIGGVPKSFGSYAALAADPEVDVVYVGTTNQTHIDVSSIFVEAGKPVVVEKPACVSAAGAKRLVALAREKDVFVMQGLWTRFLPAVREVRRLLHDEKAIGDIVSVHADFGFVSGDDARTSRAYVRELGGGSLLDIGIYPLSFVSLAFAGARPSSVAAVGALTPSGVDDCCAVALKYPVSTPLLSGVGWEDVDAPPPPPGAPPGEGIAMITSTFRGETPEEVVFVGTKGRLRVKGPAHVASALELTAADPTARGATTTSEHVFPLPPDPPAGVELNYPLSQAFTHQVAAVNDCLRAGARESAEHPNDEMVALLETMDAIRAQLGVVYPEDEAAALDE